MGALSEHLRLGFAAAGQLEREIDAVHRLCHVLASYLCRCPPPSEGYQEIHPECVVHRLGGLQDLIEESCRIELDPAEVKNRRHLLRVAYRARAVVTRQRCSCTRHEGYAPSTRPWPGCAKHQRTRQ